MKLQFTHCTAASSASHSPTIMAADFLPDLGV